ncbi:hypothetical protein [Fusobacterium sp.]|uniref:hypothetical protein n=1 Tax=Fusobacterium sp. TaxID=68766 RepID=UPI0026197EAA|nr:hypothetical protein [Fusobacterium sp.]
MKKIFTFMYFLISIVSFSENKNITLIDTLKMFVNEKTYVNKKSNEKSYDLIYLLPKTLKKVMVEPKSHRGEIFIYKDSTKIVYLPIFDQITREENSQEENFIVETIRFFQENYKKNSSFRKVYDNEKSFRVSKKNLTFEILKMENIDGYRLPTYLKIYEDNILLAELKLSKIKVNEKIPGSEFEIK